MRYLSLAKVITCVAMFVFAPLTFITAQTESVIHSFQSTNPLDGGNPFSVLVVDKNGALYGTTAGGGRYFAGTIYKLIPPSVPGGPWTEHRLYDFTGGRDGGYPSGAIVLHGGKIYGTTQKGGANSCAANPCGVVYELSPPTAPNQPWTETVLYAFGSFNGDGNDPVAGVISDSRGRLYGTTYKGGTHQAGNVFVLSPPAQPGGPWLERNLYSFLPASDGVLPFPGGLALDASGALYGPLEFSEYGGLNVGSVFQLTPPVGGKGPWTENVLYNFLGSPDGANPVGAPVLDPNGVLYGATLGGGNGVGCVFSLTPPTSQGGAWTEAVLYSFTGLGDGYAPVSGPVFDSMGALYGVTEYGGISSCGGNGFGCGTAYKLTPPSPPGGTWTEETLHAFAGGSDGSWPGTPLLLLGTSIYGTTVLGGTGCGGNCGTVFQITQ